MPSFSLPIFTNTTVIVSSGYEYFADFTWNWLNWTGAVEAPQAKINKFMVNNKRRIPSVKVFKQF